MRTPIKSKVKRANVPLDEKWYWVAWFTWHLLNDDTDYTGDSSEYLEYLQTGRVPPAWRRHPFTIVTTVPLSNQLFYVLSRCMHHVHFGPQTHDNERALLLVTEWLDAYMLRNLPLRRKLIKEYFGDW